MSTIVIKLLRADEESIEELMERFLRDNDPRENDSYALCLAAQIGNLKVVQILLPHSDPKACHSWALRMAAENGNLEVVEFLIPHSEPKACYSAALCAAAGKGHSAVVELLIPHSDPKAMRSMPLRRAASGGHLDCVRLLIPHSEPTKKHWSAFSEAVKQGHIDCAHILMPVSHPEVVAKADPEVYWIFPEYREVLRIYDPVLYAWEYKKRVLKPAMALMHAHDYCDAKLVPLPDAKATNGVVPKFSAKPNGEGKGMNTFCRSPMHEVNVLLHCVIPFL